MRENEEMIEWEEVKGNFYGKMREKEEIEMEDGKEMMLDIDWKGEEKLKEKMKEDVVQILIMKKKMRELKKSIKRREEEKEEVIEKRMKNERFEIKKWVK